MLTGMRIAGVIGLCSGLAAWAGGAPPPLSQRVLEKEVIVNASPAEVWAAWTTEAGVTKLAAEAARIELRPGGMYEWYFKKDAPEGKRGAEGCTVLSFIPEQMLAFTWNAPPSIPEIRDSGERTQVVVRFDATDDGKTRLRLQQHGFGESEPWQRYFEYFDRAWGFVLGNCVKHFADRSTRDANAQAPAPETKSWTEGKVTITSTPGPNKRQDFELTIPACVEDVWSALATTAGVRRFTAPKAEIDLRPGGSYGIWPGAPNKVLAFVPNQMLSVSGSAPPQFPTVRQGGTWAAYFLERVSANTTKLRLSVVGWRDGDQEFDAAFDYFLKNNAVFLNGLAEKLTAAFGTRLQHSWELDAPIDDVWAAFTTPEQMEKWMVAHAQIDLRVGGKMLTHYKPDGVLGDPGTIENTILSLDPPHMLSIKATKAPADFPLKNEIESMWSVIYLDPLGPDRTRLTIVGLGYGVDEASQKLRGHFDWGNQLTGDKLAKYLRKRDTTAKASD